MKVLQVDSRLSICEFKVTSRLERTVRRKSIVSRWWRIKSDLFSLVKTNEFMIKLVITEHKTIFMTRSS